MDNLKYKNFVVHCKQHPFDVYIGRSSRGFKNSGWGNPFVIGQDGERDVVIAKYRIWLLSQPELINRAKSELRGKVLGCWCKGTGKIGEDVPCHGDVLAEIANN